MRCLTTHDCHNFGTFLDTMAGDLLKDESSASNRDIKCSTLSLESTWIDNILPVKVLTRIVMSDCTTSWSTTPSSNPDSANDLNHPIRGQKRKAVDSPRSPPEVAASNLRRCYQEPHLNLCICQKLYKHEFAWLKLTAESVAWLLFSSHFSPLAGFFGSHEFVPSSQWTSPTTSADFAPCLNHHY